MSVSCHFPESIFWTKIQTTVSAILCGRVSKDSSSIEVIGCPHIGHQCKRYDSVIRPDDHSPQDQSERSDYWRSVLDNRAGRTFANVKVFGMALAKYD